MVLKGEIVSGLGVAKMWVSKIENIFEKKTNMKVFHGTLNIKLKEDYVVEPDWIIKPKEYGGTQNVLIKKCKIFDKDAYIVRAEKNQTGTGDYDLTVIEILSDINYRKKFKLKDKDVISIDL